MTPARKAAVAAGVALLLMAVLAPLGLLVALPRGATGVGAATVLVVAVLDVVAAVALLRVVGAGSPLSRLAAALRISYAAVFLVAGAALLAPADVDRFQARWDAGLLVFGVHLVVLGLAFVRARHLPSWVGAVVVVAGLGYVVDALALLLDADLGLSVAAFTFVGEVVLMVWLLARGGRGAGEPDRPAAVPAGTLRAG